MTFKTITIKKRGGGTRRQKVKVLSSGKFKFVKNSAKSTTKRKTKRRSVKRSVKRVIRKSSPVRIMARRRRSTRRMSTRKKSGFKIPLIDSPLGVKLQKGAGKVVILSTALGFLGLGGLLSNPVIRGGIGLASGDPITALGAAATQPATLQIPSIGGLFGGGGGANMEGMA